MYKIKYRISDGVILAYGAMPDLKAGPDEAVEDTKFEDLRPGMIRDSAGVYRDKSKDEKEQDEKTKAERKEMLKEKLKKLGIDKEAFQALRELSPEDF